MLALACAIFGNAAHAAVEILPGGSPQRAMQGVEFGAIRVRVSDAAGGPVPSATVAFTLQPIGLLQPPFGACFPDMGWNCRVTTDSTGEATLPTLYGLVVGSYGFAVTASLGTVGLGGAYVSLTVDPIVGAPTIAAHAGADQSVTRGSRMAPLVVRVLDAHGQPMPGIEVRFAYGSGARVSLDGNVYGVAVVPTDNGGFAASPAFTALQGLGAGRISAHAFAPGTHYAVVTDFNYTVTTAAGATFLPLQDMWWSGFAESGWGLSVAQHDDRLFAVLYTYDAAGKATWTVLPEGGWGDRFYTFGGNGYVPRGSPFYAYDASRFQVGKPVNYLHLTFDDATNALLRVKRPDNSPDTLKPLVKQDYASDAPAPMQGLADMWWGGPGQDGWGIALMEQPGGLFAVWLTYDEAGLPTWFVMPSGTWTSASTWEGVIYRTSGPTWPAFDKSLLRVAPVGSFAFRFQDAGHARFDFTVDSHSGSMPIEHQPF